MKSTGTPAFWAVWVCAAAAATSSQAQEQKPTQPTPRTQRTGVVKGKTTKMRIENQFELKALGLIPAGYTYSVRGRDEGDRFVVSEVTLTAPEGAKTIRMTRFDEHVQVHASTTALRIRHGEEDRTLRANPNVGLETRLGVDVRAHGAPAHYYSLRGWAIDVESGGEVKRTLLVDAVRAQTQRRGSFEWVKAVYPGSGRVVVEEETGDGSQRYTPRHFTLLRTERRGLPYFARGRDRAIRTGTIRARKTPTRVENREELSLHGLIPTGYAYVLTGREEPDGFEVDDIALTSPDGKRTIQMRRFDAVAQVAQGQAGLKIQDGSSVRAVRKNPARRLEAGLAADTRKHEAEGTYRLRGWAIDIKDGRGVERSVLLDGVRAQLKRRPPVWLTARHGPEGGIVVEDDQRTRRLPWKPKRLHLLRGDLPLVPAAQSDRRGLTATLRAAGGE